TTPATWDLAMPDLSGAGFDPTWALRAGTRTDWEVTAFGDNFRQVALGSPAEGATFQFAAVTDRVTALTRVARSIRGLTHRTAVQQPTPTISVSASPATLTLTQGQSGSVTVSLTRGGNYTGAVTLAVSGAPSNVIATLSPTSLTGTTLSSTLSVAAGSNATAG